MKKTITVVLISLAILLLLPSCNQGVEDDTVQSNEAHNHYFSEWEIVFPASCTENGRQQRYCLNCDFFERADIEMIPHSECVDSAVAPTCTSDGLTEGSHCTVCNEVIIAQNVVQKLGHTVEVDPAVSPTCTSDGLTEGSHCTVCNEVILAQNVVQKLGHTVEVDPAVSPTCTSDGLTEGSHCTVCNEVILAQNVVQKMGHTVEVDPAVSPTCTSEGLTEGSHCSVCRVIILERNVVPELGHDVVADPAVLPTCTQEGKSEGAHCGVCQLVLIPQAAIPTIAHQYDEGKIVVEAFFWKSGIIKYSCTADQCDHSYEQTYTVTTITRTEQGSVSESEKLYSFCAISDVHIGYKTAEEDLKRALIYAEQNCDFTCIAGDLTSNGAIEGQLITYEKIVDTYAQTKPVYAIAGNHEHYDGYSDRYLEKYTGYPLYYSFTKGDDVFIMLGHYGAYRGDSIGWLASEFVSAEELQWLYETLEANRNKRCFIFVHVMPNEHGVGNPDNLYADSKKPLLWETDDGGVGQAFISLLNHYKNAILFHGHSHTRFDLQEYDASANCSDENGYRSVHIPSLTVPRDAENGVLVNLYEESEGYIIDVYDDFVILKGRDFIDLQEDGHWITDATYRIDTKLYTIEANTFTDSTGTITVTSK